MLLIILVILSSTGILICFKSFNKYKIEILPAIVINYIVAVFLGSILSNQPISFKHLSEQNWLGFAFLIGFFFVITFFIIGKSSQKAGILITSLASKMSFIIPIMFSIFYFNESVNKLMLIGFTVAIISIALAVFKPPTSKQNIRHMWLPISLFAGTGFVDTLVKYSQETFLLAEDSSLFIPVLFAIAAITGLVILYVKNKSLKELTKFKTIIGGCLLGIANFGSLYYLIAALNHSGFKSSVVFSLVNIGIVSLSLIFGLVFYKEKISKLNYLGIVFSFIAIIILAQ